MGKKSAKGKRTEIHDAAHLGNVNQIKELLIKDPEQRNVQDEHDWTPLHWAAAAGQVDAIILLLNWGADPNSVDDRLVTPLHLALRGGYIQVAMRLIERGAEPWRLNSRSENCLHSCIKLGNSDPQACDTLTSVLLYHRKYHPAKFMGMMNAKESHSLTPLQFAKETNAPASVVLKLTEVKIPEEEHVITILLHGWNDKIADWEQIEQNFNTEVQLPFHLFKYDSLANRVSIETLAKDLYNFINEKLELYYKEKSVSFTRLTAGGAKTSNPDLNNTNSCAVNIICYSTGGLIVRTFMQNYYRTSFRSRISRVIFLAPANFGSPFAKFGKSSVGRLYTGKWNLGSLFECGEELLTSLEPSSPFLWELAHKDAFLPPDQQFYVPSEVMATIIQGSRHYPKNLKSAVTRGDMRGTDGTVTISGASMRLLKYQMNLCGGSAAEEVIIQKSTSEVALRLHPSHTHRSIIDSLLLKSDVFYLVRRALETTREQFRSLQQSFKEENEIFESPTHSPGNLLVFSHEGNAQPIILPMVYIHRKDYSPKFGQKVDPLQMKVESDASLTGKIREEFTNQIYHSRSRNMFYTISDLPTVSKLLLNISVARPGQAASLVFALKEYPEQGRVIACTAWAPSTGDCFYSSNIDTTLLFSLSPITQDQKANIEKQVQPDLSNIDNSTYVINSLTADKLLNDTLLNLKIKGLVNLCRSLQRDDMLEEFVKIVCFARQKELSGKTRALIIRALAPFFSNNSVQEGAAMLIGTVPQTELSSLKTGLDLTNNSEDESSFEGIASNLICRSLHQLVFKLFKPVPIKLLRPEVQNLSLSRYISNDSVHPQINLGVYMSEFIHTISEEQETENNLKVIVFAEDTIQPATDEYYLPGELLYPGANGFFSALNEVDRTDVVILKSQDYHKEILLDVPYVSLSYPEKNEQSIQHILIEYISLYPEYFYTIIGNGSSLIFNSVINLLSSYESIRESVIWTGFRSIPKKNCEEYSKKAAPTPNQIAFSKFVTFIDATIAASKANLSFSHSHVVSICSESVEAMHLGLLRTHIAAPVIRWKELSDSLEKASKFIGKSPNPSEVSTIKTLLLSVKQSHAGLLLSESGVEMLLKFKQFLQSGEHTPKPFENFTEKDILVELCTKDPELIPKFKSLFLKNVPTSGLPRVSKVALAPPSRPPRDKAPPPPLSKMAEGGKPLHPALKLSSGAIPNPNTVSGSQPFAAAEMPTFSLNFKRK